MKLADIKVGEPDQRLNEAERVADRAWAAARAHLASTSARPEHNGMVRAVDYMHVCYMKLRMTTTGTTRPPIPDLSRKYWLKALTTLTELTRKLQLNCSMKHMKIPLGPELDQ